MDNIMNVCIKEISIGNFNDLIIWIGTVILVIAGIAALFKKPK